MLAGAAVLGGGAVAGYTSGPTDGVVPAGGAPAHAAPAPPAWRAPFHAGNADDWLNGMAFSFAEKDDEECHTAMEGEECYDHVMWAMENVKEHPELYGGLTEESTFVEFQDAIRSFHTSCPKPCFPVTQQAKPVAWWRRVPWRKALMAGATALAAAPAGFAGPTG